MYGYGSDGGWGRMYESDGDTISISVPSTSASSTIVYCMGGTECMGVGQNVWEWDRMYGSGTECMGVGQNVWGGTECMGVMGGGAECMGVMGVGEYVWGWGRMYGSDGGRVECMGVMGVGQNVWE